MNAMEDRVVAIRNSWNPQNHNVEMEPLRIFFQRELLKMPIKSSLPCQAESLSRTMVRIWSEAGYSLERLSKEYNSKYKMIVDPKDRSWALRQLDWCRNLEKFLSQTGDKYEDYDSHCLVMTTLNYFSQWKKEYEHLSGHEKRIQDEELRRLRELDSRTIFVSVLNPHPNFNENFIFGSCELIGNFVCVTTSLFKLILIDHLDRKVVSDTVRYTWANKFPSSTFELIDNERFKFSKILTKPRNKLQLVVSNILFDSRKAIYLESQLRQTFAKKSEVRLDAKKKVAVITFANISDAEESFFETGDAVIKGLQVTVCYNR